MSSRDSDIYDATFSEIRSLQTDLCPRKTWKTQNPSREQKNPSPSSAPLRCGAAGFSVGRQDLPSALWGVERRPWSPPTRGQEHSTLGVKTACSVVTAHTLLGYRVTPNENHCIVIMFTE